MSLNKAMTDLYKQKKDISQNRHPSSNKSIKRPTETNIESTKIVDNPIPIKRTKADDILTHLNHEPKASFDKLYGCDEAINQVKKITDRFQRYLKGEAIKSQWPVLICGSRGLGKTSLVEGAANYAKLRLFVISFKTLIEQSRNELKVTLTFITRHCDANQPAIVLLDDMDRVLEKDELKPIVHGTLSRLMEQESKLLVFCTASSPLDVSSSLDFLLTIRLKRPDMIARCSILKHFRDQNMNFHDLKDQTLSILAFKTPSFSPLDLKKMLDIAETDSNGKPTQTNCDLAIDSVKLSMQSGTHLISERPSVTWDDIGGLDELRETFTDILMELQTGEIDCKFAGIALHGPPGCGKTMVAQAMANQAGLNFISIKPAELVDKFLGETEKNIRRVFSEAQEHEPCMIYFDEFDGLCGTRGNKDTNSLTSAIHTLLTEMDGFAKRGKSIILASTNRLEDIDPAMKRPGRLSKHIYVGPPNVSERLEILKVLTKNQLIANDVKLDEWAKSTRGFTGSHLAWLVSQAKSLARSESKLLKHKKQPTDDVDVDMDVVNQISKLVIMNNLHMKNALEKLIIQNKDLANMVENNKPNNNKVIF